MEYYWTYSYMASQPAHPLARQPADQFINNNNNDFFCANILKDQAQWHDKTKGLSIALSIKEMGF